MPSRPRNPVIGLALTLLACGSSAQRSAETGVHPGAPGNWHVVLGARSQKVAAASLGVPNELAVEPGLLWLLVGSVTYPLVKKAGSSEVELLSPAKRFPEPEGPSLQIPPGFHDERVGRALSSDHPDGSWYSSSVPVAMVVDDKLRPQLRGTPRNTFASTYLNIHLVADKSCAPAEPSEFNIRTNGCFLEAESCETSATLGDRTLKMGPFELDILAFVGICIEPRTAASS